MSSQQTGRPAADSHDLIQVRGARENNLADVDQLLQLLDRLVDLGPGAGHDGGQVVFTGTPADLVAHGDSLTARHLRAYLQGG
jgi:hypothetical protein